MKSQNGFMKLLTIILIIVIIALVSYIVYQNQQITNKTAQQQLLPSPSINAESADWKTYSNETYGYSIDYPSDWSIIEQTEKYNNPVILNAQIFNDDGTAELGSNEVEILIRDDVDIEKIKKSKVTGDAGMGSRNEVTTDIFNGQEIVKVIRNYFWYLDNGGTEDKGTQYFIYVPLGSKYLTMRSDIQNKNTLDKMLTTFKSKQ